MRPVSVVVHQSESSFFPYEDEEYDFKEFEAVALQAALWEEKRLHAEALALSPDSTKAKLTVVTVEFDNDMQATLCLSLRLGSAFGIEDFIRTRAPLDHPKLLPLNDIQWINN